MFKGRATYDDCTRFLERHAVHPQQRREFCGIPVSSLALGTYLGHKDEVTDLKVAQACVQSFELGCNFIDTAINYRDQRAERSIAEGLRRAVLTGKMRREEVFISTKAGFVPREGSASMDMKELFEKQYVDKGLAKSSDLIAGCHCMEPAYLEDQIERSRRNLQLETIDLFYIHNPETQLEELPDRIFYDKLERAFEALERAVADGRISAYGLATWSGLRESAHAQTSIQLEKCVAAAERAARSLGKDEHHLRAVQLPLNLAMPEAALLRTQQIGQNLYAAIDAAEVLGLSVAVSVPLFQSRLCHGLPDFILEKFPVDRSQAHCALLFSTSFAAVDAAMVGMKALEHVKHNLEFLKIRSLNEEELRGVVQAMLA